MGLIKHKNGDGIEVSVLTLKDAFKMVATACLILSVGWSAAVFYYKGQADLVTTLEAKFREGDAITIQYTDKRINEVYSYTNQKFTDFQTLANTKDNYVTKRLESQEDRLRELEKTR